MSLLRIVNYLILILSLVLAFLVLLQAKGSGLSGVFGGEGNIYHTRRGIEKGIFILTIILAIVFVALCLGAVILNS